MRTLRQMLTALAWALCCLGTLLPAAAEAQTFVSAGGDDANNCARATPCRTLQRGIKATRAGRVLTIVDAGDYGKATINKSITIVAANVAATVRSLKSGSTALTINDANAVVALKGLIFSGGGSGPYGIRISAAATVHIENCTVERFTNDALISSGAELIVTNSVFRASNVGLNVTGGMLTVADSRVENNNYGLITNGTESAIARSVISGNASTGLRADDGRMNVAWTTVANNGDGLSLQSGEEATIEDTVVRGQQFTGIVVSDSLLRISNSTVTDNTTGISNFQGFVLTRGNNTITGNETDLEGPAPTPLGGT